ncbi:hypothetical protein [Cernens ardua]|uniref:hypothetical protein n=1 Tax=Cernens ardua TaxID=3402176 RepID=UPI003F9E04D3
MIKHVSMLQMRKRIARVRKSLMLRHSSRYKSSGAYHIGIAAESGCLRGVLVDFSGKAPVVKATGEEPCPAYPEGYSAALHALSLRLRVPCFQRSHVQPVQVNAHTLLPDNGLLEENLFVPRGLTPHALTTRLTHHVDALSQRLSTPLTTGFCAGLYKVALDLPIEKAPQGRKKTGKNRSAATSACTASTIPCYLGMCRQALLNRYMVAFSAAGFNLIAVESTTVALARLASFLPGFALVYHTDHALILFVGHPLAGWYQSRLLPPDTMTFIADVSSKPLLKPRGYRRALLAYRYFDHCAFVLSVPRQQGETLSSFGPSQEITALEQLLARARELMSGGCEEDVVPGMLRLAPHSHPLRLSQLWLAGKPFAHSEEILSKALALPVKRFSPSLLFSPSSLNETFLSSVLDKTNSMEETNTPDLCEERYTLPLALAWRGAYTC